MSTELPKITPGQPETYNRKWRRAMRVIAREQNGARRFALLGRLIGTPQRRADKLPHALLCASFAAHL